MKCIVFSYADGSVGVIGPAARDRRKFPRRGAPPQLEDERTWLERVAAKSLPVGSLEVHLVDRSQIPADRSQRHLWRLRNGRIVIEGEEVPQLPGPEPTPVRAVRKPWSVSDLLKRAESEPLVMGMPEPEPVAQLPVTVPAPTAPAIREPEDDSTRRRAAKAHIRRLVAEAAKEANGDRLRYEQGLLAHSGNTAAMENLQAEAMALRISVEQLADRIIQEEARKARRMMQVYAIEKRALADLDNAVGEDIAAVEKAAAEEINPNATNA
jgi:hypothetical protein